MKVMIINSSYAYDNLFTKLGHTLVADVASADMLVFTGGEDVSPHLYGDHKHHMTGSSIKRDASEAMLFDDAKERGLPMVGICRGGQFLNVMSGGRMYQHVGKHCGVHEITDVLTGEVVQVSSTHHQMMKPSEKGLLVATAYLGGEREWYDQQVFRKDVSTEDVEVVFYPHTRCLCFQPHPEFVGDVYIGMYEYFKRCLERFIYEEVEV